MSEFRFRRLERHKIGGSRNQMELSIPPPQSPTGMIYRCCPVPNCTPNLFQLGEAPHDQATSNDRTHLIRRAPRTPGITCPYCGHDASDDEFVFRGDIEAAKKYIEWAVKQDVGDHLEKITHDFNRKMQQAGGGLFSMKMDIKRSRQSRPFVWREDLLRNLICDICRRRYGVYAIALFCPDCGARNLHVHFQREVELLNQQIDLAKKVGHEANPELAYRLLGNAHEDVLTAFETYLKTIYRFMVKRRLPKEAEGLCSKKAIGNHFQNIERGQKLFAKTSIDPYKNLSEADLNFLRLNIEKRHVLGHNLGLADEAYVEVAQTEQPGQTVTLLAEEITCFAEICRVVVQYIEGQIVEFRPPVTGNPS